MIFRPNFAILFVAVFVAACGSTSSDGSGGSSGSAGAAGLGGSAGTGSGGTAGGGSGGAAGSASCAALCGAPGCPACQGPSMIPAEIPEKGAYRIDSTEVTNAQYAQFLAANVDSASQPAECAWNTTFVPNSSEAACTGLYDPGQRADYPVVCVDWCDARAYCEWAGKRLCLRAGGLPTEGLPSGEWMSACSAQATLIYPYGNTYDPNACNGDQPGTGDLAIVSSLPGCEGGLPGLYDMSGNADEWAGSCDGSGAEATCSTSGGSYNSSETFLKCVIGGAGLTPRSFVSTALGFRCCADPLP